MDEFQKVDAALSFAGVDIADERKVLIFIRGLPNRNFHAKLFGMGSSAPNFLPLHQNLCIADLLGKKSSTMMA
jgi:hypothetical protein